MTMDRHLRLYYFPSSYYSQKVLIVLQEKEVKYESKIIHLAKGQQNEAWYMRINSSGTVPTLQDGEKIIKESEDIIDYVDREFPGEIRLVPDISTEIGKEVAKWRKILNAIPIEQITFGVICNPELSVTGLRLPRTVIRSRQDFLASPHPAQKKLEILADQHPDLREAYMNKISLLQTRCNIIPNKERITDVLNDLEKTLNQVEEQLKKVDAAPSKELWFCGQQFTAADISLCVLIGRLDALGLGKHYYNETERPRLYAYWIEAQNRSSVHRVTVNASRNVMVLHVQQSMKTLLPVIGGLVTLGLAAGLAFLFTQKR